MEFESPDVEKEFPGLYASESGKRSNESDFSDEAHERLSKKDLLIGKRKEKKDSKKDRGYAALAGESSPEDDPEMKSPSKSKKSKSFKFPTSSKKEKREKSREKDGKEKERDADKEKKKDKEGKVKLKLKERKKWKHGEESDEARDELPVFGVALDLAVARSHCHDGVDIPLVVRDSIDYLQENGLNMENVYKVSGIKSKVQHLRRVYNQREVAVLTDYEPPTVTSLLKQFFRELPEPVLTNELLARFEEAAASKQAILREKELATLVQQLPDNNRQLLAWLMVHLDSVTLNEKCNKMNAQTIAIILSPVLQMSHRLVSAMLCHTKSLFPDISLTRYVPPLSATSPAMPDTALGITEELKKQESLLNQIHQEMNAGFISKRKEEQLWEVQRIITQLKRKLRTFNMNQRSVDEEGSKACEEFRMDLTLQKTHSCSVDDTCPLPEAPTIISIVPPPPPPPPAAAPEPAVPDQVDESDQVDAVEDDEELQGLLHEETMLHFEQQELLCLQADLQGRVQGERAEIDKLRAELTVARTKYNYRGFGCDSSDASSSASLSDGSDVEDQEVETRITQLRKENVQLQQEKWSLIQRIMAERETCLHLRVQVSLLQLPSKEIGAT